MMCPDIHVYMDHRTLHAGHSQLQFVSAMLCPYAYVQVLALQSDDRFKQLGGGRVGQLNKLDSCGHCLCDNVVTEYYLALLGNTR